MKYHIVQLVSFKFYQRSQKLLLSKRQTPIIEQSKLIPAHQIGFRKEHRTIEQAYSLVYQIDDDLESKRYCSVAFIDISQAFDKVWHTVFYISRLTQQFTLNNTVTCYNLMATCFGRPCDHHQANFTNRVPSMRVLYGIL